LWAGWVKLTLPSCGRLTTSPRAFHHPETRQEPVFFLAMTFTRYGPRSVELVMAASCPTGGGQSLKIFWSEASLGLRRGVVVGKIGMATSHLAVER
jgi:hypothetical protein